MTITQSSTRIAALTLGVAAVVAIALSAAVAAQAQAAVCPGTTFSANLSMGQTNANVLTLQQFLNTSASTQVAVTGAGSPGSETSYFGGLTKAAVEKFQTVYAAQVLTPVGLTTATGYWGASSRAEANAICAGSTGTTSTGGTTTTGTAAGTAVVSAAAQPANSIAPKNASRVPFTAFTVTANGAPVTVNSVSVQRQGPSLDTDFSGVVLINASTGVQLGISRVLDANHSATIGTPVTIPAGSSVTFWVAGNISATPGSGDVASFAVTAVNTASTVSGSFPIVGASNTMNSNLVIGQDQVSRSSFDPNSASSQPIGTTAYRFSGIRLQADSSEDETLHSITWYQSGSASGLQNVMTVVNGVSYPTVVDSTGRYYTAVFPAGIVIAKGNSLDVYVQADLGGNTVPNTSVQFDIYHATDLYLTGNTYGYGITPINNSDNTSTFNGSNFATNARSSSGFQTSANPWFFGSTVTVTAGSISTIQNATSVAAQNIPLNVPNTVLGGFQTNLTGEAITAQSVTVHFTTVGVAASGALLTNVSLVNQNGGIVAGPFNAVVEGGDNQKVTFTGSILFPVGLDTYTLEGQLPSTGLVTGNSIQASTTPSTDWSSVTGNTTGNSISLPASQVTMNTMTVEAAALNVANGTTPTAQTVVAGGNNVSLATVQLDASQSGENLRLSSIPLVLYTTGAASKSNLSACQLWNGSTAVNTGTRVINSTNISNSGSVTTFSLDNALTVPKGTVLNLGLTCNISSSATSGTYEWSVSSTTGNYSVTGAVSTATAAVTVAGGAGPIMTLASGATLAVSGDASSPSYTLVSGGTTGVTVNVIKFRATNEGVNLQKLGLQLTNAASSSPQDLTQVYVYAGNNVWTTSGTSIAAGTLLGTASFTGSNTTATSTLSQVVQLPNNADATLVIKADIADIGTSQPGTEGHLVAVDYLNAQGTGANSGQTINAGSANGSTSSAGVRTFNTIPTVALDTTLPTTGVADGRLMEFKITADSHGQVGINQFTFTVATSTATVTNVQLFAYTDPGYSQAVSGNFGASTGQFGSNVSTLPTGSSFKIAAGTNPVEIPAGATYYFQLKGTVAGVQTGSSVVTTLSGDSAYPSLAGFMGQAVTSLDTANNFVWSPNATTTVAGSGNDWTDGFGVFGLPASGIIQSRSN